MEGGGCCRALKADIHIASDLDIVQAEGLARQDAENAGGSYISPYNDLVGKVP